MGNPGFTQNGYAAARHDIRQVARAAASRPVSERLEAAVHRGQWVDPTDRTTVEQACVAYATARPYGAASTAVTVDIGPMPL